MNLTISLTNLLISGLFVLCLTACSESKTPTETLPDIVERASFPYFKNFTLFNFNPLNGEAEKLVSSNKSLMITLDTDSSDTETTTNEDDESSQESITHSPLPEYVVYVNDQSLYLYDFETRYVHTLLAFEADENNAIDSYICDLKKVITLDEIARKDNKILYKDEKKVYIKTSQLDDCSGDAASFTYLQVNIEESPTETFEVRRTVLNEHKHKHTHLHDHEGDHNHTHTLTTRDPDPDNNNATFDPTFHAHEHANTHDLQLFGDLDEHQYLTNEEINEAHNNTINTNILKDDVISQEIIFETHKILVGKKSAIDLALMYSGRPIVDIENEQFGYLGFNPIEAAYKFYHIRDTDTLEKELLWQVSNEEFLTRPTPPSPLIDSEILSPTTNRPSNYVILDDGLILEHNWKVIKFNLLDLFDDDQDNERDFSLSNPIFTRTEEAPYKKANMHYNTSTNKIAIEDNNNIYQLDNADILSTKLLRQLGEEILDIELRQLSEVIFVEKVFEINESSYTAVSNETSLEETLFSRNSDKHSFMHLDDALFFSYFDATSNSLKATALNSSLNTVFDEPLNHYLWTMTEDLLQSYETNEYITLVTSRDENEQAIDPATLSKPSIYTFNPQLPSDPDPDFTPDLDRDLTSLGQGDHGTLIGEIDSNIYSVNKVTILNKYYGFVELYESALDFENNIPKTYFFAPEASSINLNDSFGDMKLMPGATE